MSRNAAAAKLLAEALNRLPPPLRDAAMNKRDTERHAARVANPSRGRRRK